MITAAEKRYLRKSVKKTKRDRIRNAQIRKDLRLETIINMIERKGLRWLGNFVRLSDDRKHTHILEARAEEK